MGTRDLTSEESKKLEESRNLTAKGNELWLQGRFADTSHLYEQAATIVSEVLGQNSTEYAFALRNLANLRYVQEKYDEAEESYLRVLQIVERNLGPTYGDLVEILTWLAETRFHNQQYDEAEGPYQRALAMLMLRQL